MKRHEQEAVCRYFVLSLTRDALWGRSQGCGFANEVAKGQINRLATIARQWFVLGEPISSSKTCVTYAIIATIDKKQL